MNGLFTRLEKRLLRRVDSDSTTKSGGEILCNLQYQEQ
jgi:hypothetical protein